jgi:amino acid transporter
VVNVSSESQRGLGSREDSTLRRDFTMRSAVGVAFSFVSPIVALFGVFGLVFAAAGPSSWWAFFIVLVAQFLVAFVFGELVSKWPYAGSLYQWSRRLAGETYGWFCGWTYMFTLMIATGSSAFIATGFLPAVLGVEPFDTSTQVLVALLFVGVGTAINLMGHKGLKALAAVAVVVEILGSVGIGIILLAFHREQPITAIFETPALGVDSGWIWGGMAAAVAYVGWAFVGFESAGAIAEEVKDPTRALPKAMLISLGAVGAVVLFSALALTLAIPDFDAVISSGSVDPATDTILLHLGEEIARPLFLMFIFAFLATFVAAQAAASRMIWSFARDNVLPASGTLKRLMGSARIPVPAIILTAVIPSLVILTSTQGAVYSTMVLFATAGFYIAFAFPLVALCWKKLTRRWVPGPFNAGRASVPLVVITTAWVLFELINISWPRDNASPWYIQWAIPLMVGVIGGAGALVWWTQRDNVRAAESVIKDAESVINDKEKEELQHGEH